MMYRLDTIFGELGISQYLNAFIDQGFDSWETILDITESDLDALGVKLGHRRKLQRRIANSRGLAPDASLAALAQDEQKPPADAPRPEGARVEMREGGPVVITKRKYRRHPKPDENAPERPPSAYVLFSNKMREDLKGRNLTFTEIAKLVGENWQSLAQAEKEPFESQAAALKDKYHSDLVEYKKTPEYKKYCVYLQEFKLKHSGPSHEPPKRVKLESTASVRNMANGTPGRPPRSGSGSRSRQGSEPSPGRQQRFELAAEAHDSPRSASATPGSQHASPEESLHSPTSQTIDRLSAERSPTFSTSPRDHPMPLRWEPNWISEDQRLDHGKRRRPLPSLSDVFESQNLMNGTHHPNDMRTFPFPRDHAANSPGPAPGLISSDGRPATLRKEQSSAGSTSSNSSYGYPRTPVEGPLPIHALLSSKPSHHFDPGQQSYFPGPPPPPEHKRQPSGSRVSNGVGPPSANGIPNGHGSHPLIHPRPEPGFSPQPHTQSHAPPQAPALPSLLPRQTKRDANLDGMSALLKAGEIVGRRAHE